MEQFFRKEHQVWRADVTLVRGMQIPAELHVVSQILHECGSRLYAYLLFLARDGDSHRD